MEASTHIVRVYNNVHDWYRSADNKAQILLATATVFLGFLGKTLLIEPDKLSAVLATFGAETYLYLFLLFFGMSGAIFSALMCLRSRLPTKSQPLPKGLDSTLFFGYIARMPLEDFKIQISECDKENQDHALANQIWRLSQNVNVKHRWINKGLLLLVGSLLAFVLMCISYACRTGIKEITEFSMWLTSVSLVAFIAPFIAYWWSGRSKGEPR
jgi:hypothetical protein